MSLCNFSDQQQQQTSVSNRIRSQTVIDMESVSISWRPHTEE